MLLDENGNPIPENQNQNPQNQNPTGPTSSDSELALLRQLADTNARNSLAAERRAREAEEELAKLRNNNAPKPVQMTSEEFFADPISALNAAVAAQIAPLREFSNQVDRQNKYQALKNRFLQDARYSQIVQSLGFNLDQIMSSLDPTESNMINAIQTLVGQYALNNPQLFNQPKKEEKDPSVVGDITPQNKPTPVTPPHLRPSAAPSPSNGSNNAPKKNYTENEKRLMREGGYSEEEWEVLLNSGSDLDAVRKFRAAKKAGK